MRKKIREVHTFQTLQIPARMVDIQFNSMPLPVEQHAHDYIEIVFVVKGTITHRHPYGDTAHAPGDIFLINLDEVHWYDYVEKNKVGFYNLMLDAAMYYEMMSELQKKGGFDVAAMTADFVEHESGLRSLRLEGPAFQMTKELLGALLYERFHETIGSSVMERSILLALMVQICRAWEHTNVKDHTRKTSRGQMIIQAVSHIQANYLGHISIDGLASEFYVSADYFRKTFKQLVGISPLKYINNLRIQHAEELMHDTSLRISDIALQSGFNDLNNFTRIFTGAKGVTPSAYRKWKLL